MNNRQYDMLDILNILSFIIGVMNYDENLTQGDKQDLMKALEDRLEYALDEVHTHLEKQDKMLKELLDDKDKTYSGRNA